MVTIREEFQSKVWWRRLSLRLKFCCRRDIVSPLPFKTGQCTTQQASASPSRARRNAPPVPMRGSTPTGNKIFDSGDCFLKRIRKTASTNATNSNQQDKNQTENDWNQVLISLAASANVWNRWNLCRQGPPTTTTSLTPQGRGLKCLHVFLLSLGDWAFCLWEATIWFTTGNKHDWMISVFLPRCFQNMIPCWAQNTTLQKEVSTTRDITVKFSWVGVYNNNGRETQSLGRSAFRRGQKMKVNFQQGFWFGAPVKLYSHTHWWQKFEPAVWTSHALSSETEFPFCPNNACTDPWKTVPKGTFFQCLCSAWVTMYITIETVRVIKKEFFSRQSREKNSFLLPHTVSMVMYSMNGVFSFVLLLNYLHDNFTLSLMFHCDYPDNFDHNKPYECGWKFNDQFRKYKSTKHRTMNLVNKSLNKQTEPTFQCNRDMNSTLIFMHFLTSLTLLIMTFNFNVYFDRLDTFFQDTFHILLNTRWL